MSLLDMAGAVLVVVGVVFLTLGVFGMLRMPDTYAKAHAVGKTVVLGVLVLLAAAATTGEPQVVSRVVLVAVVVLVTAPVVAHAVGRAVYEGEHRPGRERATDDAEDA